MVAPLKLDILAVGDQFADSPAAGDGEAATLRAVQVEAGHADPRQNWALPRVGIGVMTRESEW